MKKLLLIPVSAALLGACMLSPEMLAQTPGSVSVTATISDTGYGPEHWVVVWVTNANTGAYVRTIRKQSFEPQGTHWNDHCDVWYAAADLATSTDNFAVAADGFTGATASDYAAPNSPFTQTWDCTDANGNTVPDGNYKIWIQYAENDDSQPGPVTTNGLLWTKGPNDDMVNPNDQDTNFTNMSIKWTAAVVKAPEIAVEQPLGNDLTDGSATVNLGSLLVGKTGPAVNFTIKNKGDATLTGLDINKDGTNTNDFVVSALNATSLAPGDTMTFSVTFTPKSQGPRSAAIHITSNDADENPFDIQLTATARALTPEIVVQQPVGSGMTDGVAKRDFGTVIVGKTGNAKTFTIKNIGTGNLSHLAITKNGTNAANFIVTQPAKTLLTPGTSTTFTVTFKPTAIGSRVAAIHIKSNDANENPFDINLTGLGAK